MFWRMKPRCLLAVVVVCLLARAAFADPPETPGAQSLAEDLDIDALVREAATIIDAVLEHHVDPPTRQEMWLAGARSLLAKAGVTHRAGLSREISRLTTPAQFAEFAKRLWSNDFIGKAESSDPALHQAFINGILAMVPGKAHFISRKELAVQEQFQGNRYIGTGIALSYDGGQSYPQIAAVIPGGPMEQAGGQKGDFIQKIDGRDVKGTALAEVIDLLRGDEGTDITLVVRAIAGEPRTITVSRGPVVFETLEGLRKADDGKNWDFRVDDDSPIRYVKITQINGSTVHDLKKLERRFRRDGAQAVILDLRSADRADLHHVVLLADALLDGGRIGRLQMQGRVREFRADRDCLFRDWQVGVLVDSRTAGGAEWVAAAVQDNRAGIVVGEATAGTWHVDLAIPLSQMNAALSMRTGIFERPNVPSAQKSQERDSRTAREARSATAPLGVTPDYRIPPRDRAPMTGPFSVLQRPVPPIPGPQGPSADDVILRLAVKSLKARLNLAQISR